MKAFILLACLVIYASSQGAVIPTNTTTGCAPGCAACNTWSVTSWNVCTSAAAGFYLSGSQAGVCTACAAGASACSTASVATACNAGYFLASGVCTACNANCKTCTAAASTSCTACLSGYKYTAAAGTCNSVGLQFKTNAAAETLAATGVTTCAQDGNNNGVCISYGTCTTGNAVQYSTGGPSCATAASIITNCALMGAVGAGAGSCWQYNAGIMGTGATAAGATGNITNCQLYTIATTPLCFACNAGWYPSTALAGTSCVECGAITGSCTAWPTGTAGSYWNTTAWVSCPVGAATCSSGAATTTVWTCASGYYLNNAGVCASGTAPAATANCMYSNGAYCTGCMAGYFMSAPSGASACGANCTMCTGASACVTCAANNNLTAGVCVASKGSMRIVASFVAFFSMVLYYFL